jgi:hypothetical protein
MQNEAHGGAHRLPFGQTSKRTFENSPALAPPGRVAGADPAPRVMAKGGTLRPGRLPPVSLTGPTGHEKAPVAEQQVAPALMR